MFDVAEFLTPDALPDTKGFVFPAGIEPATPDLPSKCVTHNTIERHTDGKMVFC